MTKHLKIDFVSDVVCPWCVVGLRGLDTALERMGDDVEADITFHAFELNPKMPPGGEPLLEHITRKYGIAPDEARANAAKLRARAADVGFAINTSDATRIVSTFDAHRLLAWAKAQDKAQDNTQDATQGRQAALKHALFAAYFTDGGDPSDRETLVRAAEAAGLDGGEARKILETDGFATEVREEEALWARRGIEGVPAVIVDDRYLIVGGQLPEEYERQLRAIMAAEAAA